MQRPQFAMVDALVAVDDDQPHSPLNRIKASSSNPSVGGMKRLLARLELIPDGLGSLVGLVAGGPAGGAARISVVPPFEIPWC